MTWPIHKPYVYQSGWLKGTWKPTDKDKQPPENPCVAGSENWRIWEEGFRDAKREGK
jgi:hypothetical protein